MAQTVKLFGAAVLLLGVTTQVRGLATLATAGAAEQRTDEGSRLTERLQSDDRGRRLIAASEMCNLGPSGIPVMVGALEHDDPAVRYWAVTALQTCGAEAAKAAPKIRSALKDSSAFVRIRAAYVLCSLDRDGDEPLRALTAALASPHQAARTLAAELLGRLGPKAADAVPALEEAAKDPDYHVRNPAVRALDLIRGPDRDD